MFKCKIMNELIKWKNNESLKKKALIIKGLRQIGKTYIVKKFADEYYPNTIYINFKNNESKKTVFEGDLDVDRIMMDLSSKTPSIKIIPYKTLIIFDEVQECANARASIKPFVEDGRFDNQPTHTLLLI